MIGTAFIVLLGSVAIVRVRGMVVVMRLAILCVRVIRRRGAILVMPERRALPGRNSGQTLERDGQGQQGDGEKSEECSRH